MGTGLDIHIQLYTQIDRHLNPPATSERGEKQPDILFAPYTERIWLPVYLPDTDTDTGTATGEVRGAKPDKARHHSIPDGSASYIIARILG
ncbi:GD17433 [Drosophila simulans]|uniref:GD17433 n=1 Tax=Drosophila simulans TaxID=7240 RepID=B4R7C5_DROSI|nr:GD17433 [Drosophila simulans]